MSTESTDLCGATVSSCRCNRPKTECTGVHLCKCGGSWSGEPGHNFCIHEFPHTYVGPEEDEK